MTGRDDAYERVREASGRLATPTPATALTAAQRLLQEWWDAALRHGVTPADLDAVTDLPAAALDAVWLVQRRRERQR
jgi:hypothetical protein